MDPPGTDLLCGLLWPQDMGPGTEEQWRVPGLSLRMVCVQRMGSGETVEGGMQQGIMGKMGSGVQEMWVQILTLPVGQSRELQQII